MVLDFARTVQHVDPVGEMGAGFHGSCTKSQVRCSLLRSNAFTAAASAAFKWAASTEREQLSNIG
jgi:hypothetical protein